MRIYLAAPLFTEAERAFNLGAGARARSRWSRRLSSSARSNLPALTNVEAVVAIRDGLQSTTERPGRSANVFGIFRSMDPGRMRASGSRRTSRLT